MNGLRVFKSQASPEPATAINVFYSRRGNGPIYRWLYEEKLAQWRVSRMNSSDFVTSALSPASWKSVPEQLQLQLSEHYIE